MVGVAALAVRFHDAVAAVNPRNRLSGNRWPAMSASLCRRTSRSVFKPLRAPRGAGRANRRNLSRRNGVKNDLLLPATAGEAPASRANVHRGPPQGVRHAPTCPASCGDGRSATSTSCTRQKIPTERETCRADAQPATAGHARYSPHAGRTFTFSDSRLCIAWHFACACGVVDPIAAGT